MANSFDTVGRHYMGHTNSVMMAISRGPNPTTFQKTLGVNDFYFGSKDFEYPMGHISFVGKLDAITRTLFLLAWLRITPDSWDSAKLF